MGIIAVLLAIVLASVMSYYQGFAKGKKDGQGEGYDKGYTLGKDSGRNEGHDTGYREGFVEGRDKGIGIGAAAGNDEIGRATRRAFENEHKAKLETAHRNGIAEGERKTLAKIRVIIEPYQEERKTGLLSKEKIAGYKIAYYFDKFPIGEPLKREFTKTQETDKAALSMALSAASSLVSTMSGQGISGSILPSILFKIGSSYIRSLNRQEITGGLRNVFENNGVSLSQNAAIAVEEESCKWLLTSGESSFLLKKLESDLGVYFNS